MPRGLRAPSGGRQHVPFPWRAPRQRMAWNDRYSREATRRRDLPPKHERRGPTGSPRTPGAGPVRQEADRRASSRASAVEPIRVPFEVGQGRRSSAEPSLQMTPSSCPRSRSGARAAAAGAGPWALVIAGVSPPRRRDSLTLSAKVPVHLRPVAAESRTDNPRVTHLRPGAPTPSAVRSLNRAQTGSWARLIVHGHGHGAEDRQRG